MTGELISIRHVEIVGVVGHEEVVIDTDVGFGHATGALVEGVPDPAQDTVAQVVEGDVRRGAHRTVLGHVE